MKCELWLSPAVESYGKIIKAKQFAILSFSVIYVTGFSDYRYLNLSGIIKRILDLLGNVTCEDLHLVVGDNLGLNHDSNLTAGLDCEGLFNTLEVTCNLLKLLKSLDVVFNILTSRTGSCSADSICSLDNEVKCALGLYVVVVSLNCVDISLFSRYLVAISTPS